MHLYIQTTKDGRREVYNNGKRLPYTVIQQGGTGGTWYELRPAIPNNRFSDVPAALRALAHYHNPDPLPLMVGRLYS